MNEWYRTVHLFSLLTHAAVGEQQSNLHSYVVVWSVIKLVVFRYGSLSQSSLVINQTGNNNAISTTLSYIPHKYLDATSYTGNVHLVVSMGSPLETS